MKLFAFVFLLIINPVVFCQETDMDEEAVQQLEQYAESSEEAAEELEADDYYHLQRHPINLNKVSAEELKNWQFLTELQIVNLLIYRKTLGFLIHTYELQSIPGWDIKTIRRMLPYITISEENAGTLKKAVKDGEHTLIIRYGRTLQESKGFTENKYLGRPHKLLTRYRYRYKNALSWGISSEKDAGEPFLNHAQKTGFDFYSFHVFKRGNGFLKALVIGDFTVNMGQGLVNWQSLAFKKSAAVINIKRQSPVLKPYTSTGEYHFMRGLAISLKKEKLETSVFASWRKLSVNLSEDPGDGTISISSFLTSGLHRTENELDGRKAAGRFSAGAVCRYSSDHLQFSLNTIYHHFSYPVIKQDEPYNFFALNGKSFSNHSFDYSYTWKNLHVFGEVATDRQLSTALIQGLMISPDPKLDAAFLYRRISRQYQSVSGNAFTENSLPNNEEGFYAAVSLRLSGTISLDGYLDIFRFPWLKYRVNAPSTGRDYLLSISLKPDKKTECYSRFMSSSKSINHSQSAGPIDPIIYIEKKSWRTHILLKLNRQFTLQHRFEFSSYKPEGDNRQEGCMVFSDLAYKPVQAKWSAHGRLQYFTIDSYEARIYAYEAGMSGLFSIPALYGKGARYLLNLNYRFKSAAYKMGIQLSALWTQTLYHGSESIGSGLDEINGNRRSDLTLQIKFSID